MSRPARRRTLLPLAEGRRLQQPNIEGDLVQGERHARQRADDQPILTARVGLCGDGQCLNAQLCHDLRLELSWAERRALQQVRVSRRRADRALEALAAQLSAHRPQRCVVSAQIVGVAGEAIADGRRLGGLQMREGEARQVGGLFDALGEDAQQLAQLL